MGNRGRASRLGELTGLGAQTGGSRLSVPEAPIEVHGLPGQGGPGVGVIHPSFPLRGRWELPRSQFHEPLPSHDPGIEVTVAVHLAWP
jgi:hypothetical protein